MRLSEVRQWSITPVTMGRLKINFNTVPFLINYSTSRWRLSPFKLLLFTDPGNIAYKRIAVF